MIRWKELLTETWMMKVHKINKVFDLYCPINDTFDKYTLVRATKPKYKCCINNIKTKVIFQAHL